MLRSNPLPKAVPQRHLLTGTIALGPLKPEVGLLYRIILPSNLDTAAQRAECTRAECMNLEFMKGEREGRGVGGANRERRTAVAHPTRAPFPKRYADQCLQITDAGMRLQHEIADPRQHGDPCRHLTAGLDRRTAAVERLVTNAETMARRLRDGGATRLQ